jgi:CBS domain-containing protein
MRFSQDAAAGPGSHLVESALAERSAPGNARRASTKGGTMDLLKIASVPAATVPPDATVYDAVRLMNDHRVGAVAVTKDDRLAGIFTERDLMFRVVLEDRDPKSTPVGEVMTPDCVSAMKDMSMGEALSIMTERHFRHLPVVDENNRVLGLLSIRNLLQNRVDKLDQELDSVVSFFTADGIGG